MRTRTTLAIAALLAAGALLGWLTTSSWLTMDVQAQDQPTAGAQKSPSGFPTPDEVQRLYDEADLNRAVQAYPDLLHAHTRFDSGTEEADGRVNHRPGGGD